MLSRVSSCNRSEHSTRCVECIAWGSFVWVELDPTLIFKRAMAEKESTFVAFSRIYRIKTMRLEARMEELDKGGGGA